MEKKLSDLIINEFGNELTSHEFNQYVPKLRDYFIPYIVENKKHCSDIKTLFSAEITKNDIISSTIYYIQKNENVKSKSSIDDFLIALNQLFEEILFEKYPNATLERYKPFTSIASEVESNLIKLGVTLKDREVFPAIKEEHFKHVLNKLENMKENNFKAMSCKVIFKLLLLYGLSFERIIEMKIEDFDIEKRLIIIPYNDGIDRHIALEISYKLYNDFLVYIDLRGKTEFKDSKLLFINTKGKNIKHDWLSWYLDKFKGDFESITKTKIEGKNPFTPTGFLKYAIINMILEGMNQSIIMTLTGAKEDIFSDCQEEVDRQKNLNRNRYINHKIRGISSFDMI